jgi:hypothetical protein
VSVDRFTHFMLYALLLLGKKVRYTLH